jgi:hypothetical protein
MRRPYDFSKGGSGARNAGFATSQADRTADLVITVAGPVRWEARTRHHVRLFSVAAVAVVRSHQPDRRGESVMGKHKKEMDCSTCNGQGGSWKTNDGKRFWAPCAMCNGSGKQ